MNGVAKVCQGNVGPPQFYDPDFEVFDRMDERERRIRFRPKIRDASLESRLLLTYMNSGQPPIEAAEVIQGKVVAVVAPLESHAMSGISGSSRIHGASQPGRSLGPQMPPPRMAWRQPAPPSGRPIAPARNVTLVPVPSLLSDQMMAVSTMQVEGAWTVRVTTQASGETKSARVELPPPTVIESTDLYASLPLFDPSAFGWLKGQRLAGVSAQEGVISGALDAESLVVRLASEPTSNEAAGSEPGGEAAESETGSELVQGIDYEIDPFWGTIGRMDGGRIGENDAVTVTYRHFVRRLDAVILQADGQIVVRPGEPSNETPVSPVPYPGEKLLGRVFLSEFRNEANSPDLFPVRSTEPATLAVNRSKSVASLLPQIIRKLRTGKELRILAWGDSVTDGQYLQNPETQRWQDQFVARLKQSYPRARITLWTEAWPGHGTADYADVPAGHPRHFERAVLGLRPDLVISEFVNDAYLTSTDTVSQYERILARFRRARIDWIVMTPHFTHPQFMGFPGDTLADRDPRAYVDGLKLFANRNGVELADASALWAGLIQHGMPYASLLSNGINHPGGEGQALYVDALMALFGK